MNETFRCHKCGKDLPVDKFSAKKGRRGHSAECKDCHNKYVREVWYPRNRQKQIRSSNMWKKNNKAAVLSYGKGVNVEEVKRVLSHNDGKCEICGSSNRLVIDHDHNSKKVRGILCGKCNSGLGFFNDDTDHLASAIKYINKSKNSVDRINQS